MALGWLEAQEPPVVTVPVRPLEAEHPRAAWVVTNIVDPDKVTHGLLPGRTAGDRLGRFIRDQAADARRRPSAPFGGRTIPHAPIGTAAVALVP